MCIDPRPRNRNASMDFVCRYKVHSEIRWEGDEFIASHSKRKKLYVDHSPQDSSKQHWKVPFEYSPNSNFGHSLRLFCQDLFFYSDNPFQEGINKHWLFALQVFSSIDRGTQNPGEEKEDPGDKTKSTTLPSTETLSWSSEYSEMYVKFLLTNIMKSSY